MRSVKTFCLVGWLCTDHCMRFAAFLLSLRAIWTYVVEDATGFSPCRRSTFGWNCQKCCHKSFAKPRVSCLSSGSFERRRSYPKTISVEDALRSFFNNSEAESAKVTADSDSVQCSLSWHLIASLSYRWKRSTIPFCLEVICSSSEVSPPVLFRALKEALNLDLCTLRCTRQLQTCLCVVRNVEAFVYVDLLYNTSWKSVCLCFCYSFFCLRIKLWIRVG